MTAHRKVSRMIQTLADRFHTNSSNEQRRNFLKWGALAGAGAMTLPSSAAQAQDAATSLTQRAWQETQDEHTIADLQAAMQSGRLTARELVTRYLDRIERLDKDQRGPHLNSILETNRDALLIARLMDEERRAGRTRGPLHGIPILLKDNIDTGDRMQTTAGSLALVGAPAPRDATVAARLRQAGAILLGKTNLSEWANFRGFGSTSGWSGRGGQTRNPYILDRNPCGSSSGSAAAVAANLAVAALGTETDGSVVCPSHANAVVGIKPTVGLTSRAGVVPISHSQDTVGVHARTVRDAAIVLSSLVGVDPRDAATQGSAGKFSTDYTQGLDRNGLRGARIGIPRQFFYGYSAKTDKIAEEAIQAMKDAGAIIIDPADVPVAGDDAEFTVLLYEFKRDLNAYLATRTGVPIKTLADAIAFNEAHANREMPYFGQEIFELAEADMFSEQEYRDALARSRRIGGADGIDAVLAKYNLDALVAPITAPMAPTDLINGDYILGGSTSLAAMAGYPLITVPTGFAFGMPVGMGFMGTAYSEAKLLKLAYAFEQTVQARRPPRFLPTLPVGGSNNRFAVTSEEVLTGSEADHQNRKLLPETVATAPTIPAAMKRMGGW